VQIAADDGRVLVAGNPLKDVQLDTRVGHPGQRGIPQAVPHEAGLADLADHVVPTPRRKARAPDPDAIVR
jgi:hypothetical protein